MGIVIDAKQQPILEPNPGRALDLNEQRVDVVPDPADLEVPAVERPILDLGTIEIGRDHLVAHATPNLSLIGESLAVTLRR
jgi:hypothetical protein